MDGVEQLYTTLIRTHLLIEDSDTRFFQQYDLGYTRFYALVFIHAMPGISLSDLSKRLLCTKGNVTRIMNSLESDGLLIRQVDQDDNRALQFHLTPKGETLLAEVTQAYQKFNQVRFACLQSLEQGSLQQLLERLNVYLDSLLHPASQ